MLFDLSDLPHSFLEDGTFVRLDVEAVDVGEVGRDELGQLFDVLGLLLPPTLVTPAGGAKGIRQVAMTTSLPRAPSIYRSRGRRADASDIFLVADGFGSVVWGCLREAGEKEVKSAAGVRTHPKPGVSHVDNLRLRSEQSGSNELSPIPLIFSAYQHLKAHTACTAIYKENIQTEQNDHRDDHNELRG